MTRDQLSAALALARSSEDLDRGDLAIFDGYGLPYFAAVTVTVRALAMLIRWQCIYMNGGIDAEQFDLIAAIGRRKFTVIESAQSAEAVTI